MNLRQFWHRNILWVIPWPLTMLFAFAVVIQKDTAASVDANNLLIAEIKKLDETISEIKTLQQTRRSLLEYMETVTVINSSNPNHVDLLNTVSTIRKHELSLHEIDYKNRQLQLRGTIKNAARLAALIRKLNSLGYKISNNSSHHKLLNNDEFSLKMDLESVNE